MGTVVEVQIILEGEGREDEGRDLAERAIVEMVRLQDLLSSVDTASEFSRWTKNTSTEPGTELTRVLVEAASWQERSRGRFNPAIGALSALWLEAETNNSIPERETAAMVAASITEPRWVVDEAGAIRSVADCRGCTLNAFAKGWIVDRAVELLVEAGVRSATINAGGDLRRVGPDPLEVGIEDPFRSFDNEPPIAAIALTDAALATSGSARRGFTIDGSRFGHVIDPRTGWPVEAVRSISVVAPTAAEADVYATMLGVEDPTRALAEAEDLGLAVLIVDDQRVMHRSTMWRALEVAVN